MALKYSISLPAPGASDVASRELSTSVDGGNATVSVLDKDALSASVLVERGQNVVLTLVDVDGSGNRSPQSNPLSFVATDTVPPPQPGELQVTGVEQTD